MTEFNFNNRETYIAWRAEWRAAYKALTAQIRQTKKELHEAYATLSGEELARKAPNLQRQKLFFRSHARQMMETLAEAKEYSKVQREAQRKAA
jgi:hypothetical protein